MMYSKEDQIIKLEHEKLHDKIMVELITLQGIMKKLGYDERNDDHTTCMVPEHDRMVIGGLMKRLLSQIPVRIEGTNRNTNDFQYKMSNLFLLLQKRISIKNVFQISLSVDKTSEVDEIEQATSAILAMIVDYDLYCEEQELNVQKTK